MYFFNDTMSIYTTSFGSLFDNIHVQRINKKTDEIKDIIVPLYYSSKTHWYIKTQKNLTDIKNISKVLPMMAFVMSDISPDQERQQNKFNHYGLQHSENIDPAVKKWCSTAIPYIFSFELSIYTKYQTEANQIISQILPFFTGGSRDIHVIEIPFLSVVRSVRLNLDNISSNINIEFDSESGDRILEYNLSFSLDGYLYPHIEDKKVIEQINLNTYITTLNSNYKIDEKIITEPPSGE